MPVIPFSCSDTVKNRDESETKKLTLVLYIIYYIAVFYPQLQCLPMDLIFPLPENHKKYCCQLWWHIPQTLLFSFFSSPLHSITWEIAARPIIKNAFTH